MCSMFAKFLYMKYMFVKLLNVAHVSLGYTVFMIHCTIISIPSLLCFESNVAILIIVLALKKGIFLRIN